MQKEITNDKLRLLKRFFKNKEIRVNGKPLIFPCIGQDPKSKIIFITAENNFCLFVEPKDELHSSADKIIVKNKEEEISFDSSAFTEEEKISFVYKENIIDFLYSDWDMFSLVNEFNCNEEVKEIFDTIVEKISEVDVIVKGKNLVYENNEKNMKVYLIMQDENFYFEITSTDATCTKKELSILLSDFLHLN